MTLLDINQLTVSYASPHGPLQAVRNISLSLNKGEVLGLVGESGSGKSTLVSAMLTLLPPNAQASGELRYRGFDLLTLSEEDRRKLRGNGIATVSQDPFTALNPVVTIGKQLVAFQHHKAGTRAEKRQRARHMLERVGISDPGGRLHQYPHELSGGIRQRIAIAAALLTEPELLIADEPTAGLDLSVQGELLNLLTALQRELGMSYLIITHNLAITRHVTDDIAIMYLGRIVESGPTAALFRAPAHPYTAALLSAKGSGGEAGKGVLVGEIPTLSHRPAGCEFHTRCPQAQARCRVDAPLLRPLADGQHVACHFPLLRAALSPARSGAIIFKETHA